MIQHERYTGGWVKRTHLEHGPRGRVNNQVQPHGDGTAPAPATTGATATATAAALLRWKGGGGGLALCLVAGAPL